MMGWPISVGFLLKACVFRFSRLKNTQPIRLLTSGALAAGVILCSGAKPLTMPTIPAQRTAAIDIPLSLTLLPRDGDKAPYAVTPERRALLNTIRYAEGTWSNGEDQGYQVLYGGGLFKDLSRHPETVVVRRYTSAAAGAYQFLPKTWKRVASELDLDSFEPAEQDQAALHLVERRGALQEIDRRGLTPAAMARLAPEWASFPTWSGRSVYGQPVKSHQDLARFYSSNLSQLRRQLDA